MKPAGGTGDRVPTGRALNAPLRAKGVSCQNLGSLSLMRCAGAVASPQNSQLPSLCNNVVEGARAASINVQVVDFGFIAGRMRFTTDNRPSVIPLLLIPFLRCTTSALLECCPDDRLSTLRPFPLDFCGREQRRCSR